MIASRCVTPSAPTRSRRNLYIGLDAVCAGRTEKRTGHSANRIVESWMLRWVGHSAPIFNPVAVRGIAEWLGGDGGKIRCGASVLDRFDVPCDSCPKPTSRK